MFLLSFCSETSQVVRHAQRGFTWKSRGKRKLQPLSFFEKEYLQNRIHIVDKRRINYLRLGEMDQSKLFFSSLLKLYRPLLYMSRDEMEQYFLRKEANLPVREYSGYVFSFLHLRRYFSEIYAGVMPQALDQERLDYCFLQDICELNQDESLPKKCTRSGRESIVLHSIDPGVQVPAENNQDIDLTARQSAFYPEPAALKAIKYV